MKYKLTIDPNREESLELVLHERTSLADEIERLIGGPEILIGYYDLDAYRLNINDIDAVFTEGDDVCALRGGRKYRLRMRLYELEGMLGESFVRLNRGCMVRISAIERFESSLGGSVRAVLSCGFGDIISRRELKNVKRRFGL